MSLTAPHPVTSGEATGEVIAAVFVVVPVSAIRIETHVPVVVVAVVVGVVVVVVVVVGFVGVMVGCSVMTGRGMLLREGSISQSKD